jgi:hypothetical protein
MSAPSNPADGTRFLGRDSCTPRSVVTKWGTNLLEGVCALLPLNQVGTDSTPCHWFLLSMGTE